MIIINDARCLEYSTVKHPESPSRVEKALELLRSQKEIKIEWATPLKTDEGWPALAHTQDMIARVKKGDPFDNDTPGFKDIFAHALRSIGGALASVEAARRGKASFSLMRPPGHHATKDRAMGFCYFSTAAITALVARATGYKKVAVYDFDVHHGNGTEDVLLNREGVAFYSVHQSPCYPNTGLHNAGNNCFNYPVKPNTLRMEYRKVLSEALEALQKFKPDLMIVSAGFDAYVHDPLAEELLEIEDYHWLGESIRKLNIPFAGVLEGGYSKDLPQLIMAYLKGIAG